MNRKIKNIIVLGTSMYQFCVLLFLHIPYLAKADVDNLEFLGDERDSPAHYMDVKIVGDRAYVVYGVGVELAAYDISDPTNPERVYAADHGYAAWSCKSFGDTLLAVFRRRGGVKLYDISSGDIPVPLGRYDPPTNMEALESGALVGDTLYCAAHQNGIYIIDITDPLTPQKVGEFSLDSSATWDIAALDSFLFVANGRFGLTIIGLQGDLHIVSELRLSGLANDINLDGNIAVISLGAHGLATIDISDPYYPILLDTIGTDGTVWGAGIAHHQVICGSWYAMELFDISDPYNIMKTGWDNTKKWAMGTDIRDDSIIAVADWSRIACYKIGPDQGPDIDIWPKVLDFGSVNTSKDTIVIIKNTGSAILDVDSIEIPADISVNPNSFNVLPGDSQLVMVTVTGPDSMSDKITYHTNDQDETSQDQRIYKNNTSFPQVGSIAPDFTLLGTDSMYHTLSDYQGKVVFLEFGATW